MENAGWVLLILLILGALAYFGVWFVTLLVMTIGSVGIKARRKGYRPPGVGLTIIGALLIACGLAASLVFLWPFNQLWMILAVPVVLSCGWVATAAFLTWLLPRKHNRVFGARRVGYSGLVIGYLLIGCGIAIAPFVLWKFWWIAKSLKDYAIAIIAAVGMFVGLWALGMLPIVYRRSQLNQATLEQVLAWDPRPPVIYLRPFAQERSIFVQGAMQKYLQYQNSPFGSSHRTMVSNITFEDYVSKPIKELIGPFVALGSPEDYSTPVGAARKYAKDEEWQDEFERLARGAAGIIIEATRSANLKWELESIRQHGWQERLFLITRHPTLFRPSGQRDWISDSCLWVQLKVMRINLYPIAWREYADELARLGYRLDLDDPGPGAVVTFDVEGRGVLLASNADLPEDFIKPIQAQIAGIS